MVYRKIKDLDYFIVFCLNFELSHESFYYSFEYAIVLVKVFLVLSPPGEITDDLDRVSSDPRRHAVNLITLPTFQNNGTPKAKCCRLKV